MLMKFTIVRSKFLEALQTVQNVVPSKPALLITANCMIAAEDGKLLITATDLDMAVKCEVTEDLTIDEPGKTTLPVRRLVSIVRELPEGQITFEINEDDVASVQCGASYFRIIGLQAAGFPGVAQYSESDASFVFDQGKFREMLKKTYYAASTDETRRILTGVLLSFRDGKLTVVSTDGRRLALVEMELEFHEEDECEIVLPPRAVGELLRLLQTEGPLRIYRQTNQVVFVFDNSVFSSKLIEGVYPNYRQVIPTGCDEHITLEREMLLGALRRVSLVATDKSNSAKLTFADNQLTVVTNTPDVGEARETLPIKYAGKSISVIFNPEYIMDCLKNLDNDEIYFELSEGHCPAIIKCEIPFIYVLMPLRISGYSG